MKRGKRRRHRSAGHSYQNPAPVVRDRRIVPVEDGPLRKRAATEYNRAMAKLEKARAELRRYQQEDGPSFGRWMAATFGALLTELRENARLLHEQQSLVDEVELEMMLSGHRNPRKAYAAVMKRRASPPEEDFSDGGAGRNAPGDEGEESDDFEPFEEIAGEIPEEDRRALFDDFVKSVLGMNPKRMAKAQYESLFAEFETEMFGKRPEPAQTRVDDRRKPAADPKEAQIKEIYRKLVRRLHPDVRADGDTTVSAIWHDVQEAYETRNLDRLETLLALTEMENGGKRGQASLSQMRGALAELGRALRAIQKSILEAKRNPAWGFSRNPYHGPLEKQVRRELEESLEDQRWTLADLKRILDDWSRSWEPPLRKPGKASKPAQKPKAGRRGSSIPDPFQTEFSGFS
jgi:hypothetical protein